MSESSKPTDPDERPRISFRGQRRPRRVYLPWWALTLIGALVGLLVAQWFGAVVGGVIGYFAWKLR